jgi:hypothetical protein
MHKKKWTALVFLLLSSGLAVASGNFFEKSDSLPVASFRLIFGLKDDAPRSWNGRVIPGNNQVLEVEADRFRDHQYEAKGWKKGIVSIKLGDSKFSNDYLPNTLSWVCSTRESPLHGPTTEWHDHGQLDSVFGNKTLQPIIVQPSVLIHLKNQAIDQPIHIKTAAGEFSFLPRTIFTKQFAYFLDGNVKVELVPAVQRAAPERLGQQDFPSILYARNKKLWVAWQEFNEKNDQLVVQSKTGANWEHPVVLEKDADIFHTGLAEDKNGNIWVVWCMQVNARWDIYARYFDGRQWSKKLQLTNSRATKNIYHKITADSKGRLWLVWQRTDNSFSQIYVKSFDGQNWSAEEQLSMGKSASGNNWWPSIAAGPDGTLAVAWDGYASGNYDVYLRRRINDQWLQEELIAGSPGFEAHPTIAIDNKKRIWLAWDESGYNWGKDFSFLGGTKGTPLHGSRKVTVVCLDGNKRLTTSQNIAQVLDSTGFWELPHIQIDAAGKPWLFVRHQVMREPDTPLEGPIDLALFEIWATRYDGEQWLAPMYFPRSSGRNDMMPATALAADGTIWAAWATDLRNTKTYQPNQLQVQVGRIDKKEANKVLALSPFTSSGAANYAPIQPNEAEQVKKIKEYKIRNNGKTYSIFRGDMHRHTDISVDGNNDGSLLDAYRYARDAASLDFVGVSNHTDAIWDTYNWWLTQKVADLFQTRPSFAAFYGYERSVEYPNGHRNIFFAKRGSANIFPIGAFEARGGYVGSGALHWHLKRNNGFSIPHTTGRTSGTDWRDNDPEVETVMEIYQGMRDSYEYPGSPRPYQLFAQPDTTKPIGRASSSPYSPSFRPLGFAWPALAKGYKLGFIASSDHLSTHVSYACIIAEELTPENLMEAIRKRRTYAATDNIILDIKYAGSDGEHLMGEEFESKTPVQIKSRIIGTGDLLQVDIIKNNAIVKTYTPNGAAFDFVYTDNQDSDNCYYYVRVIQKNGEMAWGSPAWITYK